MPATLGCSVCLPMTAYCHPKKNVAVYLALRSNRQAGGVSWPSLERIARDVGVARSTAAKAVQRLKEYGFIQVESGGGRRNRDQGIPNRYRMLPSDAADCKAERPSDTPDGFDAQQSDRTKGKSELPSDAPDELNRPGFAGGHLV